MEWLIKELHNALNDVNKGLKNSYNSIADSRSDMNRSVGRIETILTFLEDNNK